jgi:hypothetical protein
MPYGIGPPKKAGRMSKSFAPPEGVPKGMLSINLIGIQFRPFYRHFPSKKQGFLLEKFVIIRNSQKKVAHTLYQPLK